MGVLRLGGAGHVARAVRARRARHPRRHGLRGQRGGAVRRERPLSPHRLGQRGRATQDAPPRSHDDLHADSRQLHAVRPARAGRADSHDHPVAVWAGAACGALMKLLWIDAPKWLVALTYVLLGWVAVAAFPGLLNELGVAPTALVGAGGLLYTLGAVVYARQRPDPAPAVFGYHEVFHALVIAAAAI